VTEHAERRASAAAIQRAPRARSTQAHAYASTGERKSGARYVVRTIRSAIVPRGFISCFQRPMTTVAPSRLPYSATASACVDPAEAHRDDAVVLREPASRNSRRAPCSADRISAQIVALDPERRRKRREQENRRGKMAERRARDGASAESA
jgi:hypothetical protein